MPVRQRPFCHLPEAKKEIDRQIKKLVEANITEESTSP